MAKKGKKMDKDKKKMCCYIFLSYKKRKNKNGDWILERLYRLPQPPQGSDSTRYNESQGTPNNTETTHFTRERHCKGWEVNGV